MDNIKEELIDYINSLTKKELIRLQYIINDNKPLTECSECNCEISYLWNSEEYDCYNCCLCGSLICDNEWCYCESSCGHKVCSKCRNECKKCQKTSCSACTIKCFQCDIPICNFCSFSSKKLVSNGSRHYAQICSDCTKKRCNECGERYYGKYHINCIAHSD